MLFNSVLTQRPSSFSDVRIYWFPRPVGRVTGYKLEGRAENGFTTCALGPPTSTPLARRRTPRQPHHQALREITEADIEAD